MKNRRQVGTGAHPSRKKFRSGRGGLISVRVYGSAGNSNSPMKGVLRMRECRYLTVGCLIGFSVVLLAARERSLAAPTPPAAAPAAHAAPNAADAKAATNPSAR